MDVIPILNNNKLSYERSVRLTRKYGRALEMANTEKTLKTSQYRTMTVQKLANVGSARVVK